MTVKNPTSKATHGQFESTARSTVAVGGHVQSPTDAGGMASGSGAARNTATKAPTKTSVAKSTGDWNDDNWTDEWEPLDDTGLGEMIM